MNRHSLCVVVMVVTLITTALAQAGSRARYAVVVGNNHAD